MVRIWDVLVNSGSNGKENTYGRGIGPCPEHPRAVLVYTEVTDGEVAFDCRDGG